MGETSHSNKKNLKPVIALLVVSFGVLVGATIAFFTSSTSFENVFRTGIYKLISTEEFTSPSNWLPGEEIPKTIVTTNAGTIDAAVRVKFEEAWYDGDVDVTNEVAANSVAVNLDNINDWIRQGDYYYYKFALKPGETTSSFMKSVTLNAAINDVVCTASADGKTQTCESTNAVAGSSYILTITKETVQFDAYDEVWNNVPEIIERINPLYVTRQVDNTITVGDEICIDTECFNVVSSDATNVTLLAKYNLNVGNNIQTGTQGIQNINAIGWNSDATTQDENYMYPATVGFTATPYWNPDSYPADVYSSSADISTYVNSYRVYLHNLGARVVDARLLKYSEATSNEIGCSTSTVSCPAGSFILNTSFWLGTVYDQSKIYYVANAGQYNEGVYRSVSNNGQFGVRPVIVIPIDTIEEA